MWLHIALLLLVGAAVAEHEFGWETGYEYRFNVQSQTLTSLNKDSNQSSGVYMRSILIVQVKSPNILHAIIVKPEYASLHATMTDGWDSDTSDKHLQYMSMPLTATTFEIRTKNGTVKDLLVQNNVYHQNNWEVNLIKSVVSQLQVDTLGENLILDTDQELPENDFPFGYFMTMEDTVGGKCEVLYDIMEVPDYDKPFVSVSNLSNDITLIRITKTKNYTNCEQQMDYRLGLNAGANWKPDYNNDQFLSRYTQSHINILGHLNQFTIFSSETTNEIYVDPNASEDYIGSVYSKMNLTLYSRNKIIKHLPVPENLMSVGNLVYNYQNLFSYPRKSRDDLSSLRTQSDSTRSIVSSEEGPDTMRSENRDNFQSTAEMTKLPHIPYILMGMNSQQFNEINLVEKAKVLIDQISMELINPNDIPVVSTLEKFLNLIELIQLMDYQQIIELENSLLLSPNQIKNSSNDKKDNYWHILRDAVTQAGTQPALEIVVHWVKNDLLKGKEAADVLSKIPKTMLLATEEYVQTFFNFIVDDKVRKQKFLNETAPLVFAELVYYTYVSNHSHYNDNPVGFDSTIPNQQLTIYIVYMSLCLQESIEAGDSTHVQTYIAALGNIAHPEILEVFERYLTGKFEVSKFQRLMMVSALAKLAEVNPNAVRNILYKIYLNVTEAYELRVMAVYLFMKTNPPLTMLQRMAKYTYTDQHKQVNSAVKSIIMSYSKLHGKQWKDIAEKARNVKKLLSMEEHKYDNLSYAYITDSTKYIDKFLYKFVFNTVGSEDSVTPKALYTHLLSTYNYINHYDIKFKYMVSSIKQLFEAIETAHKQKDKDSDQKLYKKLYNKLYKKEIERISRILNLQSDNHEQLEGHVFYDDQYGFKFLPFDNNTIKLHKKDIHDYIESLKKGQHININDMKNYYSVLVKPTETGLPFIATLNVPKLFKLNGDLEVEQKDDGNIFKIKAHLNTVYSEKMQGKIGFILPFSSHYYAVAVDTDKQLYLPANYKFEVDTKKKTIQLNVQPVTEVASEIKLLHYSVKPYFSRQNILDFQPMSQSKDTYVIRQNKPSEQTNKESYSLASGLITVHLEGNSYYQEKSNEPIWNYLKSYVQFLCHNNYGYKKVDVYLNSTHSLLKNNWFGFGTAYDSTEVDAGVHEHEQSRTKKINIPVMSDKQPLSQMRRKRFLEELGKGMRSGKVNVIDLALDIPTSQNRQTLTLGLANSNVDKKSRSLFYWNMRPMESDEVHLEACAAGQMQSSQDILLDFEKAIRSEPTSEFDGELRFGKNCMDGKTISLKGKRTRTNERKVAVLQSKTAKKCEEEMKEDNKGLRACEMASKLAARQNQLEISVDLDPTLSNASLNKAVKSVSFKMAHDSTMELLKPKNADKNSFEAKMEMSPDFKQAQVSLYTPEMNVTLPWQDMSSLEFLLSEDEPDRLMQKEDMASCTLDKKRAVTFDDRSYPLNLGKCWHVMMITSPQENPKNSDEYWTMSQNMKMLVLVREMDNNSKQVRILLGDNEIYLEQLNEQELQAKINGQIVRLSQSVSYQHKEDNQIIFEMFELMDGSIRLMSKKYELNTVYDGYRLRVKVSDVYRKALRGLCGNYDRQPVNDFMTPRNCLLNKPEEFSATYALLQDDCQGPAKENAQEAEQSNCIYLRTRQVNIINDKEARRDMRKNEKQKSENVNTHQKNHSSYRTRVIQRNGEICFTVRPVPMCMNNNKPTEMRMKSYSVHCMPDNETSRQLQSKIEQGANPDMSQRSVSMMYKFEIPVSCNAA